VTLSRIVLTLSTTALFAAEHKLPTNPQTVVWGYYWSAAKPVLRIQPGDIVELTTMITSTPERLANIGGESWVAFDDGLVLLDSDEHGRMVWRVSHLRLG
jgi:hypothetical protein